MIPASQNPFVEIVFVKRSYSWHNTRRDSKACECQIVMSCFSQIKMAHCCLVQIKLLIQAGTGQLVRLSGVHFGSHQNLVEICKQSNRKYLLSCKLSANQSVNSSDRSTGCVFFSKKSLLENSSCCVGIGFPRSCIQFQTMAEINRQNHVCVKPLAIQASNFLCLWLNLVPDRKH